MKNMPDQNKILALEAFDTPFNKRDYEAAACFWSDTYIQHSAIDGGRKDLHPATGRGRCRAHGIHRRSVSDPKLSRTGLGIDERQVAVGAGRVVVSGRSRESVHPRRDHLIDQGGGASVGGDDVDRLVGAVREVIPADSRVDPADVERREPRY